MSSNEVPILILAEPSGESLSASSATFDPLASLEAADALLYDYLFGAKGLFSDQADQLSDQGQITQVVEGSDGLSFLLKDVDTGLLTVDGFRILLEAQPVISKDGLTYTFIGRVDANTDGIATSGVEGEKIAVALVYHVNLLGDVVQGYTLTTLLFDVAIDHSSFDLALMNKQVELVTKRDLVFDDFSKAPSGQNDYIALSPSGAGALQSNDESYHIVFTAGQAGTTQVNTSTTGIGVASQSTDPGELLRADFLTNVISGNSKDLKSLVKGSHYDLSSAYFTIAQVSPSRRSVSVQIALVAETSGDWASAAGEGIAWSSWEVLDVTGVVVARGSTGSTSVTSVGKARITVGSSGSTSTKGKLSTTSTVASDPASLVLNGLLAGDRVVVYGASTFNRLEVTNVGSYSFDFGAFGGSLAKAEEFLLAAPAIADGAPTVAVSGVSPTEPLRVSEVTFGTASSASYSGLFTPVVSGGADGVKSQSASYSLELLSEGVNSGLLDTASGSAVVLVRTAGGVVEGRVGNASGALAFTVSVNVGTGEVTLSQQRALKHSSAGSDELSLSAELIQLRRTETVVDGDGDKAEGSALVGIGASLKFVDSIPTSLQIANSQLALAEGASVQGSINLAVGADGFGGFDLSTVVLPGTFTLIDGRTVNSAVSAPTASSLMIAGKDNYGADFYSLVLDQSGYTFTLLQSSPFKRELLDFSSVKAGGPNEVVVATGVSIDGFLYNPDSAVDISSLNLTLAGSADDLNPNSGGGVGVGNGNMDRGEGMQLVSKDPVIGYSMSLTGVGGGIRDITFWWQAFDASGTPVDSAKSKLIGFGNKVETLEMMLPTSASKLYLYTTGMDGNDAYRINGIERFTATANPDYLLGFGVVAFDGDGDRSSLATFTVGLDGNGDGSLTSPVLA
ncbi:MAG: DUF5801 repeats-in-toxin domain-containing protein [Prochlorococcaceae cyanobacterium]